MRNGASASVESPPMMEEAAMTGLVQNILPTRGRTTLVLEKGQDHAVRRTSGPAPQAVADPLRRPPGPVLDWQTTFTRPARGNVSAPASDQWCSAPSAEGQSYRVQT
jgi:hypothetical protein